MLQIQYWAGVLVTYTGMQQAYGPAEVLKTPGLLK